MDKYLHIIMPNTDSSIRITVNYERPNDVVVIGKLPINGIDEVLDSLGVGGIFSTSDLLPGFFHRAIYPMSVELRAFCTPQGLFKWLCMPMGAVGAPETFQRIMSRIAEGVAQVRMNIEEAIILNSDPASHLFALRVIFSPACDSKILNLHLHRLSRTHSHARWTSAHGM